MTGEFRTPIVADSPRFSIADTCLVIQFFPVIRTSVRCVYLGPCIRNELSSVPSYILRAAGYEHSLDSKFQACLIMDVHHMDFVYQPGNRHLYRASVLDLALGAPRHEQRA